MNLVLNWKTDQIHAYLCPNLESGFLCIFLFTSSNPSILVDFLEYFEYFPSEKNFFGILWGCLLEVC